MSNVKVNGNTYNGITGIRLPLADGTGHAVYNEGAVTSDIANALLDSSISGDLVNEDILSINLGCFRTGNTYGTLSFPNAAKMLGSAQGLSAENLLLPRVSAIDTGILPSLRNCVITGVCDLSGLVSTIVGLNQTFYGATIGTLKIGAMPVHNGCMQLATITNLIWNNTVITADKMADAGGLACTGAVIENAYVPDALYDEIKALIDAGTLTTVTNLYKVSEWSDE